MMDRFWFVISPEVSTGLILVRMMMMMEEEEEDEETNIT
jgi:hypothetical protein